MFTAWLTEWIVWIFATHPQYCEVPKNFTLKTAIIDVSIVSLFYYYRFYYTSILRQKKWGMQRQHSEKFAKKRRRPLFFLVATAVALMARQFWRPSITTMMEKWERQQAFISKQWRQQNGRLSFSIAVEKSKTIILVIDTKLRKNTKFLL